MTVPGDLDVALQQLAARRPLLVASDYDGVLSRLVGDPSAAAPEPGAAEALGRLAAVEGVTVALVSGRGVRDLQETSGRRDELVRLLEPIVRRVPGARLEVKPASVAVHVREVVDRPAAAALLAEADALADPSLTKKPGKEVLELAVTDADKGTALRRLRDEIGAAAAVYLGDDVTDEDAFRRLDPEDVSVKIGDGPTDARYRVTDVPAAVALLDRLADLLR
jgi:trehalose 6-phosphate phosphatase